MPDIAISATVSGSVIEGVLVVTIDNPPVNATGAEVRQGLMAALAFSASHAEIVGLVITGAGKIFIGGADIREFDKPPVDPLLPDVVAALEAHDKPVVAALNGAALGGGLEVALSCHHRIALPSVTLGLPEVKLGLVPGAGGTQRLPRLTGALAAMQLIATGRAIKADEALNFGILDQIEPGDLVAAACALARQLARKPMRRTGQLAPPIIEPEVFEAQAKILLERARGQNAPAKAVELVRQSGELSLEQGLLAERAAFLSLRDSDQAKALSHVFFAERQVGKVQALEGVSPRTLTTVAIAGLGLMGSGIAVAVLGAGYTVIGLDQTPEAAAKGRERILGLIERSVSAGRLTQAEAEEQGARLTVTADDQDLARADLVIEAVFDDLEVKIDLFRRLDKVLAPDAILATNTSYLNPDEIAAATAHPARVLGLHFFSPAHVMRLVEVVQCRATAPEVLATGLSFARRLKKLAVVAGVTEGFIGNRIFSAYRREAEFLIEDGAAPHEIDAVLEDYGFPMGLFAVYDMAGLEIAWNRRKREAASRDPAERYVEIADRLCEAGRLGQKTGRGWYRHHGGKRLVDPEVTAIIEACRAAKNIVPTDFTGKEILSRLLKAMADEGRALLAEGIAARGSDIDLVMINGYGFPAHKGGPMFVAGV
jgi:3-hydroxyacyl-CoA dehydrogenase